MPECPANIRETKIAFGLVPQTDLVTPNLPSEMWCVTKTNPSMMVVTPATETDALDIGKGDEFPTQIFPVSMDAVMPIEKYVSSEFLAWLFCFTTGNAVKTAAGTGFKYCAEPSDPAVACINLPAFTAAEQVRTPPESVVDRKSIGMVVASWSLTMESGPGRNNCKVSASFQGTGNVESPPEVAI
jgi:hypothetical protein